MFLISPTDVEKILAEANEGPSPKWVHVAVAFIHKGTSRWDIFHVLRIVLWVWVWLLAYVLISPSLQWPFHPEGALYILVRYGIGSMVVPLFVGAMVNTKDQVFWQEREISNTVTMRLYVYQGAYIGFHVGYFFLIPFAALQNQFHIQLNIWVEMLKMIIPIFIGYSGAQLVPYNLWRAYKQLNLKEGAIFFVFAIFGPAWAWFFLKFNQTIGVFTILTAITLLTSAMAIQYQRKGNTVIPLLWIVIFYGFILICQLISFLIK